MQVIENLRDIIYEGVTAEYGWGKYGDFKVLIRRKDGHINATKLCQDGGKEFFHWKSLEYTKKLIESLEEVLGIPRTSLLQVYQDGKYRQISGTYVHQDLVPNIASWISPIFAIKVSRIVNNLIVREYREEIREKAKKIDCLEGEIKEVRELLDRAEKDRAVMQAKLDLANENLLEAVYGINRANQNIVGLHGKLDRTCEMYVPPEHLRPKDVETYAIFYCDHTDRGRVYTQTRARPFHLNRRIKELRDLYGATFREILRITPVANSRSLASEFERRIQEQGLIFNQTHQRIIIPDDAAFGEAAMADLAREVFGERREPVGAAENIPVVTFQVEKGKLRAANTVSAAGAVEPEEPAAAAPDYDASHRELMGLLLEDLRELARGFPRNKTYGGYSKLSKIDLAHWILQRRGLERLQ